MNYVTEPFDRFNRSLQEARELVRLGTTREAFEHYKDAIGMALI